MRKDQSKKKTSTPVKIMSMLSAFAIAISLLGCVMPDTFDRGASANTSNASFSNATAENQAADQGTQSSAGTTASAGYETHEWSADIAPEGYAIYGDAVVDYAPAAGEYVYTGFDALGRTQTAYALITPADFQREKGEDRESFGKDADSISGWGHNEKVSVTFPNDRVYNGYFYNRSHLIADSLGGTPSPDNLVTGTRFQNVGCGSGGGMGYPEDLARTWLASAPADATLYYAVTPVYVGGELVPRSVYVDMLSSDGKLNAHIETFNVSGDMTGTYEVDYATGQIIADGVVVK